MWEPPPTVSIMLFASVVFVVVGYGLYRLGRAAYVNHKNNGMTVPGTVLAAAVFGFLWSFMTAVSGGPGQPPLPPKPELHDTPAVHQFRIDDYNRRMEEYRVKAEQDKRTVPLGVMVGLAGVCFVIGSFAVAEVDRRSNL